MNGSTLTFIREQGKRVQLANAAAALAAPAAAGDGFDISALWPSAGGQEWPEAFVVQIIGGGALNLTVAQLCGWDPKSGAGTGAWFNIADLNGGATIALTATLGWERPFTMVAGITRLCLVGTLSASTVSAWAIPISRLD